LLELGEALLDTGRVGASAGASVMNFLK